MIPKTRCYSICKGRQILAPKSSRYIYDLQTSYYLIILLLVHIFHCFYNRTLSGRTKAQA